MRYTYTAKLKREASGEVTICVPAIDGCLTQGKDVEDALKMIIDAADLMLSDLEDDGFPIPPDTDEESDIMGKSDFTTSIVCDTDLYRSAILPECA